MDAYTQYLIICPLLFLGGFVDSIAGGGVITDCKFVGGCAGNTQGVAALVIGMKVEDAIKKIKGIKCGFKGTSCPDQLAVALEEMENN